MMENITPVSDADDIVTAANPTEPIVWYGNAHADGTNLPESKVRKPIRYQNNTQIIKTVYKTDAGEAANWSEPYGRDVIKFSISVLLVGVRKIVEGLVGIFCMYWCGDLLDCDIC